MKKNAVLDELTLQEFNYLNSLTPGDLRMKLSYEYRTGVDITTYLELILNQCEENLEKIKEKGFDEFNFGKGNLILYKLDPVVPEEKRVCYFFKKHKGKYDLLI